MKNEKLSLDEVLNDKTKEVQTFAKAEEKSDLANKGALFKSFGRPKLDDKDKVKPRTLYYNDKDWDIISKIAHLYDKTPKEFIKFCVKKEMKKERF